MKILLLGNGGRESALARVIHKSKQTEKLYISPGNPSTEAWGENVDLEGFEQISSFCEKESIDILVVGPEQPLVEGITDYINQNNHRTIVIGANKQGAQLEGSKDFAKNFMFKYNIPTARYQTFSSSTIKEAKSFLSTLNAPYVLKADGLAAGKGVVILPNLSEAEKELDAMLLDAKFGKASNKVVIEEFLSGVECSVFVLTDGKHYVILPEAKDYKKVGQNDTGLNTGGMGSVSPVPFCNESFLSKVEQRIIKPTIQGLQEEGIDYKGFIFFGLMNVEGEPYVIEYNVRMGDPESESVFARWDSDIVEAFLMVGKGELDKYLLEINSQTATTVMLCSGGYPLDYEKGKEIFGLDKVDNSTIIYHAGTKYSENKKIVTSGGRVLAVTCLGNNMQEALNKCYSEIEKIHFDKMYYRKDIGKDLEA
ncbi:MAG: phosphoribosylamine--glycine ligase [Bacteroidota bacterium]|nr:phosphoribosylamine--glycine ligase [Bacteroidota bacterium]